MHCKEGRHAGNVRAKRSRGAQFCFNSRAANGETIVSGEMYGAKARAHGGVTPVQAHAAADGNYQRLTSKAGGVAREAGVDLT